MALTDVNGFPLKWEAQIDTRRAEADAKRLKDLLGSLGIDTKPASKALADITKESSKAVTVNKDLSKTFGELSGNMQGVHTSIAKARAETSQLTQAERDLRKALKENIISEDEYIKKLAQISARRTEINNKLKEYRAQLKAVEVEQTKSKPYTSADTAFEVANQHGASTTSKTTGTVVNTAEIERARKANEAFAASSQKVVTAQGQQTNATKVVTAEVKNQIVAVEALQAELELYRQKAKTTTDPKQLRLYNSEIQILQGEIKRAGNVGKVGFDDMGNAIEKSTKKTGAFTVGLNKAWGVMRQMAYLIPGLGIAGIMALAIDPIQKLIEKAGQLKKTLAGAFTSSEYKDALKDIKTLENTYSQYLKGIKSGKQVVDQYNKALGDTAGKLRTVSEVSQFITERSEAYVKAIRMRAEAQALLTLSIDQTVEAQKRMFEGPTFWQKAGAAAGSFLSGGAVEYQTALRQISQEELKGFMEVSQKAEDAWVSLTEKSEQFNKENGFNFSKEDTSNFLKSAQSLMQKIADLKAKYARSVLSPDEAEIQAVRDEFKKVETLVQQFNANPKNKIKVSMGAIDDLRDNAIADIRYRYETEQFKVETEKQKAIFAEYEEFKLRTSKEKAEQRFGAEKAEFDSFEKYLEQEQSKLYDTAGERDLTRGEVERLKYINAELEQFRENERKKRNEDYLYAYEEAKSHADRLFDIDAEYYRHVAALGETATMEQLNNLDKWRKERISEEVSANLKIENNWERTFENMALMSRKAVKSYLDGVRKRYDEEYKAGKLTIEQYKDLIREVDDASKTNTTSFGRLIKAIREYREELRKTDGDTDTGVSALMKLGAVVNDVAGDVNKVLGSIAQSIQQLGIGDENLDKALSNVMGIVDGVGQIGKGIADKNPVDIIAGSIKALTSVIDLFNVKDRKLQKQIAGYQKQLDALGKAYKQLEKDINDSVGNSYYADAEAKLRNINQQTVLLQRMMEAERRKKKPDSDKIDAYQSEIENLRNEAEETQKAISEMLLQTNFRELSQSLANALVSAFESGENAIDAMNNTFDDFIKNALVKSLLLNRIEPIIKRMTDEAAQYAAKNNNSLLGFNFDAYRRELEVLSEAGLAQLDAALAGLGIDFKKESDEKGKGLGGAVRRELTEETGSLIAGLARAQYDMVKNHFSEAITQTELMKQSNSYALESLQTALNIERNTAATVVELRSAVVELRSINLNTKPESTRRFTT